jgi:Spy/CpxP family protein refolding chaperone
MQQPGGNPLRLLYSEAVQKELQITEEQLAKLKELAESAQARMRERMAAMRQKAAELQDLSPEERKARQKEMRDAMTKYTDEIRAKVEQVLDAAQVRRLDQIHLQMAGPAALVQEKIAQELQITDEQKQKLKDLRKGLQEKMHQLRQSLRELAPGDREARQAELRDKTKALREAVFKEAMSILTPEQRQKFEELKGKKFELDFSKFRGPHGPRGPRAGKKGPPAAEPE